MSARHDYAIDLEWTGARAGGTRSYNTYSREYEYWSGARPRMRGSADAVFRGDPSLYSPEDLLVAALSGCHLLSFLAECARAGVEVVEYLDHATGTMMPHLGKVRFTVVVLRPRVTVVGLDASEASIARVLHLHERAHADCYIANSVTFPVDVVPDPVAIGGHLHAGR